MRLRNIFAAISLVAAACVATVDQADAATPGEVTRFRVGALDLASGPLASGPGGDIWFTGARGIGRISSSGVVAEHEVPWLGEEPNHFTSIVGGPEGNIWFSIATTIGRMTPDGTVSRFPLGLSEVESSPEYRIISDLTFGPDGALWFTLNRRATGASRGGSIGRMTPAGAFTEFPLPDNEVEPQSIAFGADGNLWFTGIKDFYRSAHTSDSGIGSIGRMTPAGEVTEWRTPTSRPQGIAAGPGGSLWFIEWGWGPRTRSKIARASLSGEISEFGLRNGFSLGNGLGGRIAAGPDGNIWFSTGRGVSRITPRGHVTAFPGGDAGLDPSGGDLVSGPDGSIWFSRYEEIVRVVPGAPGIEIGKVGLVKAGRMVRIRLTCGGSSSPCRGSARLSLRFEVEAPGRRPGSIKKFVRFAPVAYSVPREGARTIFAELPKRAFAFLGARRYPLLRAKVSVAGGPPALALIPLRPS